MSIVFNSAPAEGYANRSASRQLSIRLLTIKDLRLLEALRSEVFAGLSHPDVYVREHDEAEFVRLHIDAAQGGGETLGVFDGQQLVAYGMLTLPRAHDHDNLGRFFGPSTDLARVAHLASCMVSQAYRGQHLQRMLLKARMELARGKGRTFCVAMTSMYNHASRRNLMREGLSIGAVAEFAGVRRQLLAVDFTRRLVFDQGHSQLVGHDDWDRQRVLVGEGWRGVDTQHSSKVPDECAKLVFVKALKAA